MKGRGCLLLLSFSYCKFSPHYISISQLKNKSIIAYSSLTSYTISIWLYDKGLNEVKRIRVCGIKRYGFKSFGGCERSCRYSWDFGVEFGFGFGFGFWFVLDGSVGV